MREAVHAPEVTDTSSWRYKWRECSTQWMQEQLDHGYRPMWSVQEQMEMKREIKERQQ